MNYIPIFLASDTARPALIIGGGAIATAKAEALLSVGARIEVVARHIQAALKTLCTAHDCPMQVAEYDTAHIANKQLVIAATDDDALNARIAADCRARGVLVNVVDNPPLCDFIFPALIRRGPLQIAISTGGIAPVLARMVKQMMETVIPSQFERVIDFFAKHKKAIRKALPKVQARRLFYERVITGNIAELILAGNTARAERAFTDALHSTANAPSTTSTTHRTNGKTPALYLVGAGPGDPDLITRKAIRLLGQADVVLYDRLTSPELLTQYARKDAAKVCVGKTRHHHYKSQAEIDVMIEAHLRAGDMVVRLKGGDPGVYAHGAEEIAMAKKVGAPWQIVPGITAANGCAAYAGIPLTERGGARGVRFLTLYRDTLQDAAFWQGLAASREDTLVLYMTSHHFGLLTARLIGAGFAPDTPFCIIEQGTTPHHREYPGTLAGFARAYGDKAFASPTLMIIGKVARWRDAHGWLEGAQETQQETQGHTSHYFPELPNA